jgi:drug/metabolite transporter (DMT)-like permease
MIDIKISTSARKGYVFVASAAVLFAISGSAAKFLFNNGISPFQLIQLRTTLSFLGLFIWLALRNAALLRISRKDLFYFFLLGTLGVAAAQFFYLYAISKINVAAAILLHYTGPVFIALYAVTFAHEKLNAVIVLTILGTLAGCYLVVGAYNLDLLSMNRAGIIGGILAALAFATYSLMGEYGMRKYPPWTVLFYALLFAAVIWNVAHPPLEALFHAYSALQWWWIFFIATFGTILPFSLYFKGINLIRSTPASITATLEPITAGVISYFYLGEKLSLLQILGGLMVIVSIVVLQWKQKADETAPDRIRSMNK